MQKIISKSFLLLFLFLTVNCGFKVINELKDNNFSIQEIKTSGNKRVNFKIKNNLLTYSKTDGQKILLIDLNTRKNKNIKEKNIKNEITKYQISLNVSVKFNLINSDTNYAINLSNEGDYLVADSYSATLNNEKKLIDNLTENISEKIIKKISLELDGI
jgi:outer membrane lipopolysaccharide assembly protein LptE/RlpB